VDPVEVPEVTDCDGACRVWSLVDPEVSTGVWVIASCAVDELVV
jgi:hypothetical protein